jgi:hypothetical protein
MHNYFILLCFLGFLLSCSNQKKADTNSSNIVVVEKRDTSIFEKYDIWLTEIKPIKSNILFMNILHKLHEQFNQDSCVKEGLLGLSKKGDFQKFIQEFKIFPCDSNFVFMRGYNLYNSKEIGTLFTIIDKNDSIISFKYECNKNDYIPGGGYFDSVYITDFNKNGTQDLIIREFTRCSGYKNFDNYVYDFKISKNKFEPIFEYNHSGFSKLGMNYIHQEWKDTIISVTPNSIEKEHLSWLVCPDISEFRRESYRSLEEFENVKKSHISNMAELKKKGIDSFSRKKGIFVFDKKLRKYKSEKISYFAN